MRSPVRWLWDLVHPICPWCQGEGGGTDYWGEWSGCYLCNPEEDREEKVVRIWFWEIWRQWYRDWKLNRWVDQQIAKEKEEERGSGRRSDPL
jgi:hypothetical protein